MNTHVQIFSDEIGEELTRMASIKRLCDDAKIDLPQVVEEYFGIYSLDPIDYALMKMQEMMLPEESVTKGKTDNAIFIDIDLSKLPKEAKRIRITNSKQE